MALAFDHRGREPEADESAVCAVEPSGGDATDQGAVRHRDADSDGRGWGYTPQRPVKRALEQNPVKVGQWLDDVYPMIAQRAKAEGAIIYWGDETAVAEDGHWIRGYAPVGQTPVLATPSKRHGLSMVSAISNQGLVRFEFIEEAMNADLLIDFMGKLVEDNPRKVFLILDNLKVHHARLVTAWLAERQDRIEVFYLPPYSPEINPDEYLNRDFKTVLRSSDRAPDKKVLIQKASAFMDFLVKTPERVMAYFKHAAVQYAA
jgi:transposase